MASTTSPHMEVSDSELRVTEFEVECMACHEFGVIRSMHPVKGFLIEHGGRQVSGIRTSGRAFPCRVPL